VSSGVRRCPKGGRENPCALRVDTGVGQKKANVRYFTRGSEIVANEEWRNSAALQDLLVDLRAPLRARAALRP